MTRVLIVTCAPSFLYWVQGEVGGMRIQLSKLDTFFPPIFELKARKTNSSQYNSVNE